MLSGISIWQLLILLGIIILVFGTKKLRTLGGDLGSAIRGFKKALSAKEEEGAPQEPQRLAQEDQDAQFQAHQDVPNKMPQNQASQEPSQKQGSQLRDKD